MDDELTDECSFRQDDRAWNAFQCAPVIMVVLDEEARIKDVNKAAQTIVGKIPVASAHLPGELFDCVNSSLGDGCGTTPSCKDCAIRSAINEALREGKETYRQEASLNVRVDGEPVKHYYLLSTNIIDEGPSLEVLLTLLDVTDMKRAELNLQKVNKKLNILGSFTRHDVLNQVTAAVGYLELLDMVSERDEKQADYRRKVLVSVNNIAEYMQFNRIYQELGSKAPAWQDISRSILDAHANWTQLRLEIDPLLSGMQVYADPLVNKVFYNLMDNTMRHGDDVSIVKVGLEKKDDSYSIIWEDDGVGIPEDQKERIFLQGVGKNTGLGLFLVREILSVTDISIIEDGVPGEGARFRIDIPRFDCRWV